MNGYPYAGVTIRTHVDLCTARGSGGWTGLLVHEAQEERLRPQRQPADAALSADASQSAADVSTKGPFGGLLFARHDRMDA